MQIRFAFLMSTLCVGLTACAPSPESAQRLNPLDTSLPPMNVFRDTKVAAPTRSNAEMTQDFLDLSFEMENGRALPILTRFEGPIHVAIAGKIPSSLPTELAKLLDRLQSEAGIDIKRTQRPAQAQITIEGIDSQKMARYAPTAACFVAPRVSSWADYVKHRRTKLNDWTTLRKREQLAVFIKADESPQEIRDCLHEEIAQAIGPLNDLYRLPDSVFNDDNMNTVLTGFDMLMLQAYNDPALKNGMTRSEVAAKLPSILNRLNPAGMRIKTRPIKRTPDAWVAAIERALAPKGRSVTRQAAAQTALDIAIQQGWKDHRRGFSHYILGRLSISQNGNESLANFLRADAFYAQSPLTTAHRAHVGVQLTAYALSAGEPEAVLNLAEQYLPALANNQNAALMANLMLMKAEALDMLGRPAEARNVRLDSLGWARYGFANGDEVRQRQADVAALRPMSATTKSENG
ncbi:MAG: DUF2927 domain-containing protein [Pseudoruegeria sp.]